MSAVPRYPRDAGYHGLTMTADEFFALGETPERYELINGVVALSPSPFASHNEIAVEITGQLRDFARAGGGVRTFPDTDLRLSATLVYRPDVSAYRAGRLHGRVERLTTPPDLIIEILSQSTRLQDLIPKRDAYERFGVGEYWTIDPADASVRRWRRAQAAGPMAEAPVDPGAATVESTALPGFALDLRPILAIVRGEA